MTYTELIQYLGSISRDRWDQNVKLTNGYTDFVLLEMDENTDSGELILTMIIEKV